MIKTLILEAIFAAVFITAIGIAGAIGIKKEIDRQALYGWQYDNKTGTAYREIDRR